MKQIKCMQFDLKNQFKKKKIQTLFGFIVNCKHFDWLKAKRNKTQIKIFIEY